MLTMWASVPQRARMISSMVWAVGALRLISMARMPNSNICMVAPAAYLQRRLDSGLSQDQACWLTLLTGQGTLIASCRACAQSGYHAEGKPTLQDHRQTQHLQFLCKEERTRRVH